MTPTLKRFQQVGSYFLATRKNAILADEMGLGKTAQAVDACEKIDAQRVTVVCPAIVRRQWMLQFGIWHNFFTPGDCFPVENSKQEIPDVPIVTVSYNLLNYPYVKEQLKKRCPDALIVDEAHYLKHLESLRTGNVLNTEGLVRTAARRWFLTGTPITGRPMDLFPVLKVLAGRRLHPFTTEENFGKRYCNGYYDSWGSFITKGASNLEELGEKLQGLMLRREIQELKDSGEVDIPDVFHHPNHILLDKVEMKCYLEYEESITGQEHTRSQLRSAVAHYKVKYAAQYAYYLLENVDKLVIYTHHNVMQDELLIDMIATGFKTEGIRGGVSTNKRHEIVARFNRPGRRVLLLQMDAGGTGLDGLQGSCNTCMFAELAQTPDVRDQCAARLRRMGNAAEVVNAYHLIAENTVDDPVWKNLSRKDTIIKSVYDGYRSKL